MLLVFAVLCSALLRRLTNSRDGCLKIADFGLARNWHMDQNGKLTNRVITLWYRCVRPCALLGVLAASCTAPPHTA